MDIEKLYQMRFEIVLMEFELAYVAIEPYSKDLFFFYINHQLLWNTSFLQLRNEICLLNIEPQPLDYKNGTLETHVISTSYITLCINFPVCSSLA